MDLQQSLSALWFFMAKIYNRTLTRGVGESVDAHGIVFDKASGHRTV